MKGNKLFILFMVVCITFSITGCRYKNEYGDWTSHNDSEESDEDEWDLGYEEDQGSDYGEDQDEDYSSEEDYEEETEETVTATYPFTELRTFSEGRAWVNFDKDGTDCTGVIDTDGRLLYQAEGNFAYVSQFTDGLAFYRETSSPESACGIVDLNGNVLFKSQITDDGGYLLLAYGNGHFLAAQHIRNFDTDEWRYGSIDKNGNILNEMKAEDLSAEDLIDKEMDCRYIGENFIISPQGLYNVSTGYFSIVPIFFETGDFYEGYTVLDLKEEIDLGEDETEGTFVIDTSFKYDRNGSDDYVDVTGLVSAINVDVTEGDLYSEGLIWNYNLAGIGYYDKDWNLSVSLEKYLENRVVGGAFHGGYAVITLTGTDDERYICVVDREGNIGYEPIRIDDIEYDFNDSANGFFQARIDGYKKIIGPDGKIYTPGIDDLSVCEGLTFGDVSEGLIRMASIDDYVEYGQRYYVSLDGSTIIDSAKSTSGYAGDDPEQDPTEEDTVSYIMPDSYEIKGKWKNIGEKGFGQAQPGAVVVFDGSHCNFYSPNDTYAFYDDGNKYVLDLTSLLGESLSFTVNIIDDDNINISGADLKRIE